MHTHDRQHLRDIAQALHQLAAETGAGTRHGIAIEIGRIAQLFTEWAGQTTVNAPVSPARDALPAAMFRCDARDPIEGLRCILDRSHPGSHTNAHTTTWTDAAEAERAGMILKLAELGTPDGGPDAAATIRWANTTVRYELPGRPPTERRVTDVNGVVWKVGPDGTLTPDFNADHVVPTPIAGAVLPWHQFLAERGPADLVPLTADELADVELYGPPGARWGHIGEPCPFYRSYELEGPGGSCNLWRNHAGPHKNVNGDAMGQTYLDGPPAATGITPHQASLTPCTCGTPAAHTADCPRGQRAAGASDASPLLTLPSFTGDANPCWAGFPDDTPCWLQGGHAGPHMDAAGNEITPPDDTRMVGDLSDELPF